MAGCNGAWQQGGSFGAPVTALVVDKDGRVWAGPWGNGVYCQNGSGAGIDPGRWMAWPRMAYWRPQRAKEQSGSAPDPI